jgi:hypothetical protein
MFPSWCCSSPWAFSFYFHVQIHSSGIQFLSIFKMCPCHLILLSVSLSPSGFIIIFCLFFHILFSLFGFFF